MAENLNVTTERVDDIPILLAQGKKIGVPGILDQHFEPHGNWQGTSMGWTTLIWLTHILSEGDHRLNRVERWVENRLHTLEISTDQRIRAQEWSDDRLGIVLDGLADTEKWQAFESDLNRRTFRVYNLKPQRVRLDRTTASGYWTVTSDGLFQYGHSKDHRPDQPQLKVMISALDPFGMPVATQVVSGECADDPLYIPAIQQVSASLDEHGLLYVGDCKMAALGTRAFIASSQDNYLCPLAEKQMPQEGLEAYLQPIWRGEQATIPVYRKNLAGEVEPIAEGYEQSIEISAEVNGKTVTWTERQLIVRSFQEARTAEEGLQARLGKAHAELLQLNERKQGKRRIADGVAMRLAAEKVLAQYRVASLLRLKITEQSEERTIRSYKGSAVRTEIEQTVSMQVEMDEQAVQQAVALLGWRVYVTNELAERLPLEKAVLAYREEYLIERGFGRLKGKPLSLTPIYLQSDERVTGLVRLLSIGLRMLTLIEYQVRQRLAEMNEKLAGSYAGNPKRTTERPTAEAMLQVFKGIHLSVVSIGEQVLYHVTPLSEVQQKILSLLGFPSDIYTRLVNGFSKPAGKMTEP
jgi:transposase